MYLNTHYHSGQTVQGMEEVLYVKEHIPFRVLSKFAFEKEVEAFFIEINLRKVNKQLICSFNANFLIYRHI